MSKHVVSAFVFISVIVAAGAGCASKSSSDSSGSGAAAVDEGSDANGAESDGETLSSSLIGGDSTSLRLASAGDLMSAPGELQLDNIGDDAKAFFRPAGCLVVTSDATAKTAKYVFSDCTGPHGLAHVTGEIDISWTSSAVTQLTANFSASALKINGSSINWTATANTTATGAARDMIWDGKFNGTTRNGRDIERTNHKEYKWTVGADCLSVNGSSDGTVTGHELKTDVIDFSICAASCPAAGSEIKITDESTNAVYDVKWNATNATYTGPQGNSVNFTPLCAL